MSNHKKVNNQYSQSKPQSTSANRDWHDSLARSSLAAKATIFDGADIPEGTLDDELSSSDLVRDRKLKRRSYDPSRLANQRLYSQQKPSSPLIASTPNFKMKNSSSFKVLNRLTRSTQSNAFNVYRQYYHKAGDTI